MVSSDVNRDTDLSVTLYAKSASEGAPDIAVGVVKLSPKFADQVYRCLLTHFYALSSTSKRVGSP